MTTVVALVRLRVPSILRRLIGRQFETNGEILTGVTSVSYGDVPLELRGLTLEKTTNPNPSDVAQFYVRGVVTGTGPKMLHTRSLLAQNVMTYRPNLSRDDVPDARAHAICCLTTATGDYETIKI